VWDFDSRTARSQPYLGDTYPEHAPISLEGSREAKTPDSAVSHDNLVVAICDDMVRASHALHAGISSVPKSSGRHLPSDCQDQVFAPTPPARPLGGVYAHGVELALTSGPDPRLRRDAGEL